MDPDKINDADRQIEATILKQGQDYAARNQRSKAENKGRAESRARIKEIGMDTNAYATAVRLIKDKTQDELKAWRRDFELTLKVMGSKQKELFPEEQLKAEARIQRQQEKKDGKPRGKKDLDAQTDANKRSDPSSGGAQVDLEEAIAAQTAKEQAEGDALLEGKSAAWRAGYNAFSAGGELGANPFVEGSAEARDWIGGYGANKDRSFEAAAPAEESENVDPPAPAVEPEMADGETFNQGAGKPAKLSQSAKAAAKKNAAGVP